MKYCRFPAPGCDPARFASRSLLSVALLPSTQNVQSLESPRAPEALDVEDDGEQRGALYDDTSELPMSTISWLSRSGRDDRRNAPKSIPSATSAVRKSASKGADDRRDNAARRASQLFSSQELAWSPVRLRTNCQSGPR